MARIFAGADRKQIDTEVLEAFKALPDDFWVFAEFTIGRNIDWFFVHPSSDGRTMALIMVELKRSSGPLAGDVNNTWRQWTGDSWRELVPGGPSRNYYWQAVEAANELKEWLWNNQRRYRNGAEILPPDAFKVWPDLLILSPPGVTHQLPLKPPNNFGRFLSSIEECVRHVASWNARERNLVPLTEGELERLAEALGLEQVWPPAGQPAAQAEPDLRQVLALLQRLDERLQRLEDLLTPGQPGAPASPPAQQPVVQGKVGSPAADGVDPKPRPTTGQSGAPASTPPPLRKVFGWIEAYLRERGGPCPFTTLGAELRKRHGLDVKAQYKMTFTSLLRQAEQEGRVRITHLNDFPHASLPDDPSAVGRS